MLRGLGLSEDAVRSSIRFGLGRFNTADEVERAIQALVQSALSLRSMSSVKRGA